MDPVGPGRQSGGVPCADTSWAGPSGLAAHQSVGGKGGVIRSPHFSPRGTKRRVARSALGILGGASPLKPRGQGSPATVFVACSHPRPRSRGCPALADTLWSSVRALRPAARSFCRPVEQLRLRALAAPHSPGSAPPWGAMRAARCLSGGSYVPGRQMPVALPQPDGWLAWGLRTVVRYWPLWRRGHVCLFLPCQAEAQFGKLPPRAPRVCLSIQGCSSGARLPGSEL